MLPAATFYDYLADLYRFPKGFTGAGECIGILAFGGGISYCDLARYFLQQMGSLPDVTFQNVGCASEPNVNSKYDKELALDLQIASKLAPRARIVVYFGKNDEQGWIDTLMQAVDDQGNRPSVLSVSWGATEDQWSEKSIQAINGILGRAVEREVTVCVASGDDGCAMDEDGNCRVTFPASSPFVLACGGTSPEVGRESVWNMRNQGASGGGISGSIRRPEWQAREKVTEAPRRKNPEFDGRLVPDVCGLASHRYTAYVGGRHVNGLGGTSAVAPLWSALIARINEALRREGLSRVGHFGPRLYRSQEVQESLRQVLSGQNDPFGNKGYRAGPGWNPCTGWGSPDGERLLEALMREKRDEEMAGTVKRAAPTRTPS